jgi:hypothetical protein
VRPGDLACQKQQIVNWNGLAPLLAAAGDMEDALNAGRDSLDLANTIAKGKRAADRNYLPRALAANGDVYQAFAKRSGVSTGDADSNLRRAADYYGRAVHEWQALNLTGEPYTSEKRQAEAGLARCRKALRRLP